MNAQTFDKGKADNKDVEQPINIYVLTTGDEIRQSRVDKFLSGIKFEYVNSLPREKLDSMEKDYQVASHKFRPKAIMAGEIGAFHTHSQAWEKIAESRKPGIIIEDNVEFIEDPSQLLSSDVVQIIKDCGMVSFTDISFKPSPDKPFIISEQGEGKPYPIVCYGVIPTRARNLLDKMERSKYVLPVDRWLSFPKMCGIYCYVSPLRFAIRAKKSDVSSIANKKKGKKTYNPYYIFHWAINRLRYWN